MPRFWALLNPFSHYTIACPLITKTSNVRQTSGEHVQRSIVINKAFDGRELKTKGLASP